jgi:hypothetical protein
MRRGTQQLGLGVLTLGECAWPTNGYSEYSHWGSARGPKQVLGVLTLGECVWPTNGYWEYSHSMICEAAAAEHPEHRRQRQLCAVMCGR